MTSLPKRGRIDHEEWARVTAVIISPEGSEVGREDGQAEREERDIVVTS